MEYTMRESINLEIEISLNLSVDQLIKSTEHY